LTALVRENISLADKTTFRIGGRARYYAVVENSDDLRQVAQWANGKDIPWLCLGGGSNLLVHDQGVDCLVVKLAADGEFGQIEQLDAEGLRWRVGCAALLPAFVRKMADQGVLGLEKLSGIPGTVGGALKMNAGIPAVAIGDHVVMATCIDKTGQLHSCGRDKLAFSYRHSGIGDQFAVSAEFLFLQQDDPAALLSIMQQQRSLKAEKQPLTLRSAGCIFKNPEGSSAGLLIDRAGCKGLRQGDAEVSALHANFIVNTGQATAMDVSMLIKKVRQRVHDRHGLWLELEIKTWGFDNDDFLG
jgi:UDP-N-acetylenolpyruvoylglucosamine reductase